MALFPNTDLWWTDRWTYDDSIYRAKIASRCKNDADRRISCLPSGPNISYFFYVFATQHCRRRHYVFELSVRRVRSSVRPDRSCYHDISWTAWTISDETYSEYSLALLDSWGQRSKVKGHGHSRPSRWRRHSLRRWDVKAILYLVHDLIRRL